MVGILCFHMRCGVGARRHGRGYLVGGHSPYECLTGLRARMPMDILQATSPVAAVSQQEFVQHLVTKLRNMHSAIRRAKEESHRAAMKRALE